MSFIMKELKVFNDKQRGTKRDPHRRQIAGKPDDRGQKAARQQRKSRLSEVRERELSEF